MKRNAIAKLASGLSIGLLALGMTFGATQLSLACEGEEFAQAPEEFAVAPATLDEGLLADRTIDRNAIITEPSVVVTVVVPAAESPPYELALADAPVAETSAVVEPVETAPATEVMASLSEGGQSEQAVLEQEPQYTGSTVSENEGNALVWYPEVEITIAAAALIADGGADE
jgi:hypothetical protein